MVVAITNEFAKKDTIKRIQSSNDFRKRGKIKRL